MLKFESISFSFGKKNIFEDLNLTFDTGKTYGIIGANGIGKTTLFRCMGHLYTLNSGKILWDSKKLHPSQVSFLPTSPFFYPYMKGVEYLNIVHADHEKIAESKRLAQRLNIPLDHLVDTYSTGMKKKLAFIAHYTKARPISIFDEPFNGVDLESNEILLQLLHKQKEEQVTLVSSHILSMLYELCDEIIHIEEGFRTSIYSPQTFDKLKQKIRENI
ncbi:MAG: ATP-binding cassette domain-containing protein [Saprospiraceae bacterium]|nr:ATP-binding cassette domain-containing protein [Saprospiraceae bacterium]